MPLKKVGELVVPSRQERLRDVDRFTEKILRKASFPTGELDDVAISVSEAVNNAIVHGNKFDEKKKVKICYYLGRSYLRIVVQDQGRGFSLDRVPDPRKQENLLKASGRGILIMSHLMDRVRFEVAKSGLKTIMDKFLPGRK